MGVNDDAGDGRISVQPGQEVRDGLRITRLGKRMGLVGDSSETAGLFLESVQTHVVRPLPHPDRRQGRRRAALVLETKELLAYVLQELLSHTASIPDTFHRDPF